MRILDKLSKPKGTRRLAGALGLLLALSLVLVAAPVLAIPQMAHVFYGTVTSDGQPVDAGVSVVAKINGQPCASTTVDSQGRYGWVPVFEVSADDPDTPEIEGASPGDLVDFYVATVLVDTYPFKIGGYTELNLEIAGAPPQPLTAEAGGPYSGTVGANIALAGSAIGGTVPYTFAWDLDNDGEFDDAIGATPSHSWGTADTYTIGLQVTDSVSATATDTATVTVSAPAPPPSGGGGVAPRRYYVDTNLFGIEESFRISDEGEILSTIEATSADGMLTLTIPEGSIALDEDGNPLEGLEAAVDESPPDPPEGSYIIELAYDFGPDGATFDPAITLEYTYDPADIPEDVAEEDLVLAYYDEEAGEWVELDCVVDTENNTITADVEHFTTFAIIGAVTPPPAVFTVSSLSISPATVNIGETVTISLVVTNTGGKSGSYIVTLDINGVKEADETVTVAAGDSQEVSFSVTKEDAGIYSVAVAELAGSFTVVAPAAFSVSDLSLQPAQVKPGEAVTISASVANTGGEPGSYTVVLKIDGVKEAEKTVTIAAGESLDVSFSVTKEEADTYTVTVDGLSGSFTVAPAKPPVNWPVLGGIIGGVIVVGLLVFFLVRRRRAA